MNALKRKTQPSHRQVRDRDRKHDARGVDEQRREVRDADGYRQPGGSATRRRKMSAKAEHQRHERDDGEVEASARRRDQHRKLAAQVALRRAKREVTVQNRRGQPSRGRQDEAQLLGRSLAVKMLQQGSAADRCQRRAAASQARPKLRLHHESSERRGSRTRSARTKPASVSRIKSSGSSAPSPFGPMALFDTPAGIGNG